MLTPSGRAWIRSTSAAEALGQQRRDRRGRAVRAVDQHATPAAARPEALDEPVHVGLRRAREHVGLPHARAGRQRVVGVDQVRDAVLLGVVQLEAVGAEELDPVVLERVVRRREHRAAVVAVLAHEHRHAGRGQHPGAQRAPARRGDAGAERVLEQRAGAARVAADQHRRRRRAALAGAADGRAAEPERELRAQRRRVGDAADAVGTEQPHPRRASASRTAAGAGPS